MRTTTLVAAFAAGALLAGVFVACRESISPAEAVARSRQSFGEVESFRATFSVTTGAEGQEMESEGETAFQSGDFVYTNVSWTNEALGADDIGELLFIPPDLYMRTVDSRWFVLSPWNQGVRPDETPEFDPEEPAVDYLEATKELHNLKRLSDEEIDGEKHMHLAAAMRASELDAETYGPEGLVRVDLWLDKQSYLPRKVRVRVRSGDADSGVEIDTGYEFLDYNGPVTMPDRPEARPWRDRELVEAPCTGAQFASCLGPQTELQSIARDSCGGSGRRVCLVPLGQVSPALVQHLVAHYQEQYGLTVTVLTPSAVPADIANPLREQIDAETLIGHMGELFPDAYLDPEAVLIGLTPVDLYDQTSHFRYVFGIKGTPDDPKAVVSSFRMDPQVYGEPADEALFFSRFRKLLSKYVGLLYYELPPSDDPRSPLYDSILGPDDVDNMSEPLPVSAAP